MVIGEKSEMKGDMYYFNGKRLPPADGEFRLQPEVEQYLREKPGKATHVDLPLWNAHLEAMEYIKAFEGRLSTILFQKLVSGFEFNASTFKKRVQS